MTEAYENPENYVIGCCEGDRRRFYNNRQLALNYANDAAKHWGVDHVRAQLEPKHGFVAILITDKALPEAQEIGLEVQDTSLAFVATPTPENWHTKKKKARPVPTTAGGKPVAPRKEGSQRPSRGKTLQAWTIFDDMPNAERKERIAAGVAIGLNANMLGTQHSRWAKEQKTS